MIVYIVSDHEEVAGKVRKILLKENLDCPVGHVVTLDLASERLAQARPDLVVIVLGAEPEHALAVMSGIRLEAPGRVLAVGPASDPKLVIGALRSGADDYVDQDDLEAHLREALSRCRAARPAAGEQGKLIAVLSPSGGSGSSTLAVNVATFLAGEHKLAVLLDMNLEAGDLSALLDLKPSHTMADLCQDLDRMDQMLFARTLERHSSGVHLLAPPVRLADVRHVTPEGIRRMLELARASFPYVIADLNRSYRDEQSQVLREADVILLVVRLDFTALRNARRTLEHFDDLGIKKDRVRLVINRHGQAKEVPASQAEEALGVKIFHYVPDDPRTVNRANNNGIPMMLEAPSSKVSRSVAKLAASVNGRPKPR
jgi:pilus assembly protein CpaE